MRRIEILLCLLVPLSLFAATGEDHVIVTKTVNLNGTAIELIQESVADQTAQPLSPGADLKAQIKALRKAADEANTPAQRKAALHQLHDLRSQLHALYPNKPHRAPRQNSSLDQGGEDCASATVVNSIPYNDSGTNVGYLDDFDYDCENNGAGGGSDVFYSFTPPVSDFYHLSLCNSDFDTILLIYEGCPGVDNLVACSDDDCGEVQSCIEEVFLEVNTTYIIVVDGWDDDEDYSFGNYEFSLDFAGEGCVTCYDLVGNSTCAGATDIYVEEPVSGYTDDGTIPEGNLACGENEADQCGVWYHTVGNGNQFTVTTCSVNTNGDTRLFVFAGDCDVLECVGFNDDDVNCAEDEFHSTVTWCTEQGEDYHIFVTSFNSEYAEYELSLSDDGPCAEPCVNPVAACGSPEEIEPNDTCLDPQEIGCNAEVYGVLCDENDIDHFRFTVPAGYRGFLDIDGTDDCNNYGGGVSFSYGYDCFIEPGNASGIGVSNTSSSDYVFDLYVNANDPGLRYKIVTECCPLVDYCETPVVIDDPDGFEDTRDMCCAVNHYSSVGVDGCDGDQNNAFGGAVIYSLTLAEDTYLDITAIGAGSMNEQILIFTDCDDPEGSCVASWDEHPANIAGTGEYLPSLFLEAGQYFIGLTRGFGGGGDCGEITLSTAVVGCDAQTVNLDPDLPLPQCFCARVCADAPTPIRIGPLEYAERPVVTLMSGCDPANTSCDNPDCPPAVAVLGEWTWDAFDDTWSNELTLAAGSEQGCVCICLDEILAVELAGFNAVAGDASVTLNWSTASETDNDHFDIERDGATVGRIQASNSATGSSYTWTESSLANGHEYNYSLIAIDVSGNRRQLGTVSATPSLSNATVTEYALHQNYPNPFNPETNIIFDLADAGTVTLTVYNSLGQSVATLVNGSLEAGRHSVTFDGANLTSGLYFYRMEAGDFTAIRKMILMK